MRIYIAGLFFLLFSFVALFSSSLLSQADSLFQLRDKNFNVDELRADTTYINHAIAIYKQVLEENPDEAERSEALWKLLQAFYFKGQFGTTDLQLKRKIYTQGITIGEKYMKNIPESVEVYSWLGIIWARWAEVYGVFAAARKGVANKVKYYGEKTLEMDAHYLDAGAYRLLGMLHFSVPRIPLILTWPSKKLALEYLEKANKIAPDNLYNKMYLAEVLHENKQHDRAEALLRDIITRHGIVHDLAIDSFIKQQAREFLAKHY